MRNGVDSRARQNLRPSRDNSTAVPELAIALRKFLKSSAENSERRAGPTRAGASPFHRVKHISQR
jgi:hypothetical protein